MTLRAAYQAGLDDCFTKFAKSRLGRYVEEKLVTNPNFNFEKIRNAGWKFTQHGAQKDGYDKVMKKVRAAWSPAPQTIPNIDPKTRPTHDLFQAMNAVKADERRRRWHALYLRLSYENGGFKPEDRYLEDKARAIIDSADALKGDMSLLHDEAAKRFKHIKLLQKKRRNSQA